MHAYIQQGMQAELSPICLSLAPYSKHGPEEQIPFMGVDAENEWSEVRVG
jgi:hypothetical protein